MKRGGSRFWSVLASAVALALLVCTGLFGGDMATATAQQRGKQIPVAPPKAKAAPTPAPQLQVPPKLDEPRLVPEREESVQADVSTRNVAVTSSFTGTEIVVFGAIDNSRQTSPEAGLYDVVIVIEGVPSTVTVRKKDRVAGIWLNTAATTFESVPSYYAISSTRPLDEVAPEATLIGYEIGFDRVRMEPAGKDARPSARDMREFRNAVIRLKEKDGLYVAEPHGVAFIGKSLFRSTIALPATVQVGPFETRVYLFRGERLISQYNVRISLEREGLERFLHNFAFDRPFLYGLATVILALCAGMAASAVFSKGSH